MYADLLPYLHCPACSAALELADRQDQAGEIIAGRLRCTGCESAYPIREGIADFLQAPQPASPAQWTNEIPATAWAYERIWRPYALTLLTGQAFPYTRELPLMVGLVEPRRGGLFLDVGCSNGLYARALAQALGAAQGHVAGIDKAFPMLQEARQRARTDRLRISFIRAEAGNLPIGPRAATGVTIGGSLNEIGDLEACLAEVRRTLGSKGRFVAMTLARAASPLGKLAQQALQTGGLAFWSEDELRARFERHGLTLVGSWRYGMVLFTLALVR
jgi:ubiquinone/menaquinone biosynthesis C-methylase UbiE/uncharacterized protein YbaR (Trm112 family)